MRTTIIGASIAALLTGAGCNSGGGNAAIDQCNPPGGISTTLVYPAPGSSGIPDALGTIVLGSTAPLPPSFSTLVVNNTTQNYVYFNSVGVAPSPLPTPNALPGFSSPAYQASGNPGATFVAGSSITVFLNDLNSNCAPTLRLGSFRVQ